MKIDTIQCKVTCLYRSAHSRQHPHCCAVCGAWGSC